MIAALPLAFAAPAALAGLLLLPGLWWLLRVSPPRARRLIFPPLALLATVRRNEETPARLPWWLAVLRLSVAALAIAAAAGPVWRPDAALLPAGHGPVWLILDNGFAAAPDWQARLALAEAALDEAEADNRPVVLATTADGGTLDLAARPAGNLRARLKATAPRAWLPDRDEILPPLAEAAGRLTPDDILLIASPADAGDTGDWAKALGRLAPQAKLTVAGLSSPPPLAVAGLDQNGDGAVATLRRADGDASDPPVGSLRLVDRRSRTIDSRPFSFEGDSRRTQVRFDLPLSLRNEIARAEIIGSASAASVRLVDDRWRRGAAGLLTSGGANGGEPLLAPGYFLERALSPFADVLKPRADTTAAAIAGFVEDGATAIVLADIGHLDETETATLRAFMEKGGVVIRFAGPRLAASGDGLVPVPLRSGDRVLGGALSWTEPRHLAPFPTDGPSDGPSDGPVANPFTGLTAPDDVTVNRQVLAEPTATLESHTWARLDDGTPLVTADRVGDGYLVLFHVTADTSWSNLAISGVFVEMLRHTMALARSGTTAARATGDGTLPPYLLLDGFGRPGPAPATARGLATSKIATTQPSRLHPAGLYGGEAGYRALNLIGADTPYVAVPSGVFGTGAAIVALDGRNGEPLAGRLLLVAFLLLVVDGWISLRLLGGGRLGRMPLALLALSLALPLALTAALTDARAQTTSPGDDAAALIEALRQTRLAYVMTGDPTIDDTTRAGLAALSRFLAERTSLEPGEPVAVDPDRDELAVYPLIYWPIAATAPVPSHAAMARIEHFMNEGGTVLFDTRDALDADPAAGPTPSAARLRDMLAGIDVPPLEPLPTTHVLTRTFYLLTDFPGRYDRSPLWVEATARASGDDPRPPRTGDGVSPLVITGNDLAAAWATADDGRFLYPLIPGTPSQRDHAFRAGVNIVMYVLTGNYKADQVHVPALLQRLGR